mmetsp:Transcript_28882/g.63614  ORF Transcript_28882/g.63614 Transcript_28882/m.63614 type:complete len:83 (+) Transcript_28882:1264-1512(+)
MTTICGALPFMMYVVLLLKMQTAAQCVCVAKTKPISQRAKLCCYLPTCASMATIQIRTLSAILAALFGVSSSHSCFDQSIDG